MSIENLLNRRCTQTAVYWGSPLADAYGGMSFDSPVEIPCRWEDKIQILGTITGNQIIGYQETSRAIVYLTQDVDQDGYLYLGTLQDLIDLDSSDVYDSEGSFDNLDPRTIAGAHIIKRFEKTPSLGSGTDFLRKAFLTPWLT